MADTHKPAQPGVVIAAVDDRHAEVVLTGEVDVLMLRDLEARLADPRLGKAEHWVLDMRGVTRMELACAYAVLRAVTLHSGTTAVCGPRRAVLRTLRDAGLDRAVTIEE
ncbi:STAS domain-containing protein [Streptomyces sp. NPDC059696]|uniref:STAS domain-containing protein n=1 Tax=Streptomyces sp. NPDC059696 TaxID=3346911 RepID=UPI0036B850D7